MDIQSVLTVRYPFVKIKYKSFYYLLNLHMLLEVRVSICSPVIPVCKSTVFSKTL